MNRSKFFGSRPIFYFAEPVAAAGSDGAASGGGAGSGSSGGGAGGSGGSGGGAAAPPVSDEQFLEQAHPQQAEGTDAAKAAADKAAADAKAAEPKDEINLSALEPGQPEWLAKVTDEAAKTEIGKLLEFQKAVNTRFKDTADLEKFFADLPGGREQVGNLLTLSKEVGEIDGHIEANTPEGNATVTARYMGEAPDGGLGLFRAGAQHLAKTQPEAWAKVGGELVNQTLKSSGIGADLQTVVSAVQEMRAAVAKDDGEAFGKAAAKLLGEPKADAASSADPRLTAAQDREKAAKASETKALGENWQTKDQKLGNDFKSDVTGRIEKLFTDKNILPKSVSAEVRGELTGKIYSEVLSQLISNAYLHSQVTQLIGIAKGGDLSKVNLKAGQGEFDKALGLLKDAANGDLLNRAVAKVVSAYAKERAATNGSARAAAKGAGNKEAVGNAPAVKQQARQFTEENTAALSDEELLKEWTKAKNAYA